MTIIPFQLPPGYPVPTSNYFSLPESVESLYDLNNWFNHLILCGCKGVKDGQNWAFAIDGVIYAAIWRDVAPRPPWTRAVWDVYRFNPPCGSHSSKKDLGFFWCWNDVIKVIRSDVQANWKPQWKGPGGKTVVVGSDLFGSATFEKPKGPLLWLSDEWQTSNGKVVSWTDKSGHSFHASMDEANAPTLVTIDGQSFLRFSGSEWLNLRLFAMSEWHLFIVGRYQESATNDFGTAFGAMGLESPFSGLEALIGQNDNGSAKGSLSTWIHPNFVSGSQTTSPNTMALWEWKQSNGESHVGINASSQRIATYTNDAWDPMQQGGGFSLPVNASIGRSNRGLVAGQSFHWFIGDLAEILLYDFPLSPKQRIQVINSLREKHGLGPKIVPVNVV